MIDSVRIGALEYAVIEMPAGRLADTERVADCSSDYLEIQISKDLPKPKQAAYLLHEVIHGMNDDCGYPFGSEEAEEAFTTAFAPRLLALIVDNPVLIREIWRMTGVEE
jgi:hypothetical protein